MIVRRVVVVRPKSEQRCPSPLRPAGVSRISHTRKPKLAGWMWAVCVLLLAFLWPCRASAQLLTDTTDTSNFVITLNFGTLTPGTSGTPTAQTARFRVRCSNATGYHVNAQATFSATPSSPAGGGATIAASDIGVGITSITYAKNVITPRTDSILGGLNYNPGTVTATNGLTPFLGAASGQATLANLAASTKILSGPKVANNENANPNNYLEVTMTFAVLPQFFTPATFTANVTLTLQNGP